MAAVFRTVVSDVDAKLGTPSAEVTERALDNLRQAAGGDIEFSGFLNDDSAARALLLRVMALSPYLHDIAVRHPGSVWRALTSEPEALLDSIIRETRASWRETAGRERDFMRILRRHKQEAAFAIALYDLARLVPTRRITEWLSAFACAGLSAAVDHLLLSAHANGRLELHDMEAPSLNCGLAIIGMGKLGAGELNYSSDVDLIAVYDAGQSGVRDPDEVGDVFARVVKRLIHVMQERTADGYVFRTDLRLRPDPGATPLAISYGAAMVYYEARGQNWERAAFIKARAVAGDLELGDAFCRDLSPFIFRKYLDYGTIADIHSIKRQIHAHKGHGDIAVRGHNIKLGRGGIREIEFFVQTQQLIAGGRSPELRVAVTEDALDRLAEARWIDAKTAAEMREAYWYLRDLEHRIQMRRDEQTHTVPEDDEALEQIALMMGYSAAASFVDELPVVLKRVERHYAALFENETGLTSGTGNLVFTGEGDDPDTLATLAKLGFERPSDVCRIIRTWHYGRYRAIQTAAARKRLTELMPNLLETIAETRRADDTLLRFDSFLSGLPAGIQLFALLKNNPGLLTLLVSVMSSAPRLADVISRRPHVFDGMLDPTLLAELPTRAYLGKRLDEFLEGDLPYEEVLDRLRIFASEQRFLIGMRLLTGTISGDRAARAFSDLAALIIDVSAAAVETELVRAHGRIKGGCLAILGMGKLGSREMTAESDVDIILLYGHDEDCLESDGPKPIDPARYYARFTQRLVAALSAPTAEGVLYEVDLRLRPSGNKGPVATHIRAFEKYQSQGAWTWEHMALARARVVCGDAELGRRSAEIINAVFERERDPAKTAADVADMRQRIEDEKPSASVWDLKLLRGGIIDIEFISQYLRLTVDASDAKVEEIGTRTVDILRALAPARLSADQSEFLLRAHALYTEIAQITRLCLRDILDPPTAPAAFLELLLNTCDFPDVDRLELHVRETAKGVRGLLENLVGEPQSADDAAQ